MASSSGGLGYGSQQGPGSSYAQPSAAASGKLRAALSLPTAHGPVGLRQPRDHTQIVSEVGPKRIGRGWLRDQNGAGAYLKLAKQAMLIGAQQMSIADSESPDSRYSPVEVERMKQKLDNLRSGREQVVVLSNQKKTLHKIEKTENRKRELLIKFSKKYCVSSCNKRERAFIIENGELLVYCGHDAKAPLRMNYKLKDAECFHETRASATIPRWEEGYSERLRVDCEERIKGGKKPLYLYSKDAKMIQRWKGAFSLAKVLVSENDRRALKSAIGRATSGALVKAWSSLTTYFNELANTKKLVKSMAMRLIKVDLSRGWTKFRLVYKQREEMARKRKEQQLWAARFMSEKLTKIGIQNARQPEQVRESVITRVQATFRRYREDAIFDRQYPLSLEEMSRISQAKHGRNVDFAMSSLSPDDVVKLCLSGDALSEYVMQKDIQASTTKPTYSEVNTNNSVVCIYVSDNLTSLSFSDKVEGSEAYAALSKADWSKFVNVDRISSVIMHSEPLAGSALHGTKENRSGVWCVINGPRVAWDKRHTTVKGKTANQPDVKKCIGAENGFQVATNLALGQPLPFARLTVGLEDLQLRLNAGVQHDHDGAAEEGTGTFKAVLHVLGWAFEAIGSKESLASLVRGEAAIPVSSPTEFVAADKTEIGLEIFMEKTLEKDGQKTKVWELVLVGAERLSTMHKVQGDAPLSHYLVEDCRHKLMLQPPSVYAKDNNDAKTIGGLEKSGKEDATLSWVMLNVHGKVESSRIDEQQGVRAHRAPLPLLGNNSICISPELAGVGVCTSLFLSQRAAWVDPELGLSGRRHDHVGNFVELNLNSLRFPLEDKPDQTAARYYVKASLQGLSATSVALCRPHEGWAKVLGPAMGDPSMIRLDGQRLLIPLPPGIWGHDNKDLRRIDLSIVRVEEAKFEAVNFDTFKAKKAPMNCNGKETVVYRGVLSFDYPRGSDGKPLIAHEIANLLDTKKPVTAFFKKVVPQDKTADILSSVFSQAQAQVSVATSRVECALSFDFVLRDRDYARVGHKEEKKAFCIGDRAVLMLEEVATYPGDATDFRKRFCTGQFDAKMAGKVWDRVPLREPCMSNEYTDSGLGDLVPKVQFKSGFIPAFCYDIMPYRFVLPLTEKEHLQRGLPGYFHHIVSDLAKHPPKDHSTMGRYNTGPAKPVVNSLTSVHYHVSVVLLATYADGTADVELSGDFLKHWSEQPHRKFKIPGMRIEVGPGTPGVVFGKNTNGMDRAILRRVLLKSLQPVHNTGFNVYDAKFMCTDHVLKAPPPTGDFNPRTEKGPKTVQEHDSEFSIAAGPLPPDASTSACQYEWSIRVRLPNEASMHKFVAMLRRCVRADHYQQASKMQEYQSRKQHELSGHQPLVQKQMPGGQLEVLLIEARRLGGSNLFSLRPDRPLDETLLPSLSGTTSGEGPKCTPDGPDVSTYVVFKMLANNEVVPYRGQKVQKSLSISGTDSPMWCADDQLKGSGGFTFRTGNIDPDKMPDLVIHFDVMQESALRAPVKIGARQIAVTQRQLLSNPDEPLKNLWVPLVTETDGKPATPNARGEIHIMTRWIPSETIIHLADGTQVRPMGVRAAFLRSLWPKICASRVREPVYNIEAQHLHYDPNIAGLRAESLDLPEKDRKPPEEPKDHFRRHVEELANASAYVECIEFRQTLNWDEFEKHLHEDGQGHGLGERRLIWLNHQDNDTLTKLQALIQGGIPGNRREKLWAELTLAARVSREGAGTRDPNLTAEVSHKAAELEYATLLRRGLPQHSDAMRQLQEDMVALAAIETSSIPEVVETHMKRMRKAQNVCTALLACEDTGLVYSESLLWLAFFLMLPQGCRDEAENLHQMSESSAFWLLYTLICTKTNGTFCEYYGNASHAFKEAQTLCSGSGAMHDITLLECCIAYHSTVLWQRMNALGFNLATVFYGAFMRLFATYMPTSTVFRFWDIVFSQSTDPTAQPHARAYLIDLAFGIIRTRKLELMACKSAKEMKHVLLGAMGSLYDPSTVVDLAVSAHDFLWQGSGFSGGKIGYLWTQRDELFRSVNDAAAEQNSILKQLAHVFQMRVGSDLSAQEHVGQTGLSTKDIQEQLMSKVWQAVENQTSRQPPRFWALFRPMPLASRCLSENAFDKAWSLFASAITTVPPKQPLPYLVGPYCEGVSRNMPRLEPMDITSMQLMTVLNRGIPSWGPHATAIWNAFMSRRDKLHSLPMGTAVGPDATTLHGGLADHQSHQPPPSMLQSWVGSLMGSASLQDASQSHPQDLADLEDKISLNEFFASLVCASRGSLRDRAAALFNIFAASGGPVAEANLQHYIPVNSLARSAASTSVDTSSQLIGRTLNPPDPNSEDAKKNVLRFTVKTNYDGKNTILGHAFVPALSTFVEQSGTDPQPIMFNVWGKHDTSQSNRMMQNSAQHTGGQVCLAEMSMAISWTPMSIDKVSEGMLTLNLKHIKFFSIFVSDFHRTNPSLTVEIISESGGQRRWEPVRRWDPQGVGSHQQSWLSSHSSSGNIEFEPTMKAGMMNTSSNNSLSQWRRNGEHMGLDEKSEEWRWNDVSGKQRSIPNIRVAQEFVQAASRNSLMDLQGARLLTSYILQRSMLNVSNRQAICIADSVFNRSEVVCGILEAVLSPGEDVNAFPSMKDLKEAMAKSKVALVDVTNQLVLEHERQIAFNGGKLNLFEAEFMRREKAVNLDRHLKVKDPYPGRKKLLWIRFVRGGDGERVTKAVLVNEKGDITGPEVPMECINQWPQTLVTKEEFVSCVMSTPLLGESLRRLGSCDHVPHPKRPLAIDVILTESHAEHESERLDDMMNVHQSILLEVWDSDTGGRDFLGEAWLPPFSTLGKQWKDFVLPLTKPDNSEDADRGPSRPDPFKVVKLDPTDPNSKITGMLFVSAMWNFPLEKQKDMAAYDLQSWFEQLELQGKLPAGALAKKYMKNLSDIFGSVKTIQDQQVNSQGRLEQGFFDILHITDAKEKSIFAHFFLETANKESLQLRAVQVEAENSGSFRLKITRAQNLRRADAKKFRECDPQVQVWARNDCLQAWRKRPIMSTPTIANNKNPEWKFEKDVKLLTGLYESRFHPPEEGWAAEAKKVMRTAAQQKRIDDERAGAALKTKRLGSNGLSIKFLDGSAPGASSQAHGPLGADAETGSNHKVEIMMGDTIYEFKAKLEEACQRESMYWRARTGGEMTEKAQLYSDIKIGHKHVVMIYVPSPRLRKLQAAGMSAEYRQLLGQDMQNPSSWQPLDPARTFSQFQEYGFGTTPEMKILRVQEVNENYAHLNHRYKRFLEERSAFSIKDLNTGRQCFGWAKYVHESDGNSMEWRPAVLSLAQGQNKGFVANWLMNPMKPPAPPSAAGAPQELAPIVMERRQVKLAPRVPKISDDIDSRHLPFLEQAWVLQNAGKTAWEIEVLLNKLLDEKWMMEQHRAAPEDKPPRITTPMIQSFLQRHQDESAKPSGPQPKAKAAAR